MIRHPLWIPIVCIFLFIVNKTFSQSIEDLRISGTYKNVPLKQFFDQIESENNISVFYKKDWVDSLQINQTFTNHPVTRVLNQVLKGSDLSFAFFQDNAIVLFPRYSAQRYLSNKDDDYSLIIGDPLNEGRYKYAKIKGKIRDGATGENLVGAVVYSSKTGVGVSTNSSGEYEIDLPTGEQSLQISFMGFEQYSQKIKLIESGSTDFELFEETHNIGEVTVVADETQVARTQMSMVKVNSKLIKELPVLMGEADVIKSIVMMPGVQTVGELSSGFNVRGGDTDQNLVLIDGAPVFNTSHLFGFFSMINPDAVREVSLFKGGIPASYGERVSSVMDVGLKNGNKDKVMFYGGLGLINSRFTLEGPFVKDKNSTFIVGGRSTYSDWLLRQTKDADFINSVAHFYDINAKADFALGKKNHLKVMAYHSYDEFNLNSNSLYGYGNYIGSLNWKLNITNKLISNLELAYSKYDFNVDQVETELGEEDYILESGIDYKSAKYQLSYLFSEKHRINIGGKYIDYHLRPGAIKPANDISFIIPEKVDNEDMVERGAFIDDEFDIFDKLTLNLGMRYSNFTNYGESKVYLYDQYHSRDLNYVVDSLMFGKGEKVADYKGFEPRISLKYELNSGATVKLSYQKVNQYVHQISNTSVISPADFWKSSDYYIKPLESEQFAVGYFTDLKNKQLELSTEIYYKQLKNLSEYKNGASLIMNHHLETAMIQANGYAYGLEVHLKKPTGRLNGWISYTFSRTMRKAENEYREETINKGKYYPSIYDKPHDLSAVANYKISRRWRFSANFVFASGRPVTLPELRYNYGGSQVVYFSDRNKYRMPPYHRLDVSITFDENLRKKRMWKGSWTFSIYNLYSRHNPYSVYYKRSTLDTFKGYGMYELFKLSIIGVPIPSLTYNFKF